MCLAFYTPEINVFGKVYFGSVKKRDTSDQNTSASHATNTEEAAFRKHARQGVVVYGKVCWLPWQAILNSCPR